MAEQLALTAPGSGGKEMPVQARLLARRGDPETKRFLAKVDVGENCWEWKGGKTSNGYGVFWFRGRLIMAHRASYILFINESLNGLQVLHHCDNKPCVNPGHLFLGTQADNVHDCIRKGRNNFGERGGSAKLKSSQVLEIAELLKNGSTQPCIAKMFGVSRSAILHISIRDRWKHLWKVIP